MDVLKRICEDEQLSKCGEIFLINNGNFVTNCIFCNEKFNLQDNFTNHIIEKHFSISDDLCETEENKDNFEFDDLSNKDFIEARETDNLIQGATEEYFNLYGAQVLYKADSFDLIEGVTLINENQIIEEIHDSGTLESEQLCTVMENTYSLSTESNSPSHSSPKELENNEKTSVLKELVKCQHCGACFYNKEDLISHYVVHKVNKCQYCSKKYLKLEALKKHESKHLNPFHCSYCTKTFFKRTMLKEHENTHLGIKPHKCEFCPSTFTSRTNLKVHRNRHLNIRPYSCRYCSKTFVATTERKMHERAHRGDRPAICELCGVRFLNTQKLNEHKKRHTDLRAHECSECPKSFYSKNQLKQHKLCHTTDMQYHCDFCVAKFKRKKNLNHHILTHHAKTYQCTLCYEKFKNSQVYFNHMEEHSESYSNNSVLPTELKEETSIEEFTNEDRNNKIPLQLTNELKTSIDIAVNDNKYGLSDNLIAETINVLEILDQPILVNEESLPEHIL